MKFVQFLMTVLLYLLLSSAAAKACDGHYETRFQTVCVCPTHYASQWVPAAYGCVQSGYYAQVYVPARYVTQAVSVYVRDVPVCAYGYGYAAPYVNTPVYSGAYVGGSPWFVGPGYRRW